VHFITEKSLDQPLGPVLQRLGHMRRLDLVAPGKVGKCLPDAIFVGSGPVSGCG
jgi:hypothetical protein